MRWLARLGKGSLFALCLVQPIATVGAAFAARWCNAYGPESRVTTALVVVLTVTGGLLWLSSVLLADVTLVDFLATLALMFAFGLTLVSVDTWVLARRGVTVTCTVGHVEERVVTSSDGDGRSTTTHYYDHEVRCPDGHPTRVTTIGDPAAEVEDRRRVTFDPQRRLGARFGAVTGPGALGWACAILLAVCLALRTIPWAIDPDDRYHDLNSWFF